MIIFFSVLGQPLQGVKICPAKMHHWITCIFYFHICIHGSNFGSTMRYKRVKLSRQNIVASRASSSSSFHHRHSFLQWQCVATGKGRLGSRVRLLQLQLLMSPIPTRDRDNVHLFALCKRAIAKRYKEVKFDRLKYDREIFGRANFNSL